MTNFRDREGLDLYACSIRENVRPLRVLHVLEGWGGGGTEMYVSTLVKQFAPEDCEVLVLAGAQSSGETELLPKGRYQSGGRSFSAFVDTIKKFSAKVLHLHLYTSILPTLLKLKACRETRRLPVVATFHSPISQWSIRHRIMQVAAAKLADRVLGGSQFTTSELRRYRSDAMEAPPPILYRPVGGREINRVSCNERFSIVAVGRLAPEKRWLDLIEAVSRLPSHIKSLIRIQFAGDGPLLRLIEEVVDRYSLSAQVDMLGRISYERVGMLYREADLAVLPSSYEGFGMSAVEAMMFGVPVVTSDYPASAEYMIEGKTGHRFSIGDVCRLAELIHWHVANPVASHQFGIEGQRFVQNRYSPQRIAGLHSCLYASLSAGLSHRSGVLFRSRNIHQ